MAGLHFLTSNDYKFLEYERPASKGGLQLIRWAGDIQEIQELDLHAMARHKAVEAYRWLLRPVLVDVSGMRLGALNGLPGGLNRQFWDLLHENICEVVHQLHDPSATMVVSLALCDGQRVHFADAEVSGELALHESAHGAFHLDRTFIPDGCASPLSELPDSERDEMGPRALALSGMIGNLRGTPLGRELGIG